MKIQEGISKVVSNQDLQKQEITFGNKVVKFEVDSFKKKCLIEGLDDIGLSMEKINYIDDFEKKLKELLSY